MGGAPTLPPVGFTYAGRDPGGHLSGPGGHLHTERASQRATIPTPGPPPRPSRCKLPAPNGGITTIGPRHADDTPPRASYGSNSPHRYITTKVARNFLRSFFETARKRCNSNVLNSMFEILAGELRATLLGNHADISTEEATGVKGTGGPSRSASGRRQDLSGLRDDAPGHTLHRKRRRCGGRRKAWQRFDEPTAPKQKSHVIFLGQFSRAPEIVAIPTT